VNYIQFAYDDETGKTDLNLVIGYEATPTSGPLSSYCEKSSVTLEPTQMIRETLVYRTEGNLKLLEREIVNKKNVPRLAVPAPQMPPQQSPHLPSQMASISSSTMFLFLKGYFLFVSLMCVLVPSLFIKRKSK
jgi:hypothetical protein